MPIATGMVDCCQSASSILSLVIMQRSLGLGEWAMPGHVLSVMVLVAAMATLASPMLLRLLLKRWHRLTSKRDHRLNAVSCQAVPFGLAAWTLMLMTEPETSSICSGDIPSVSMTAATVGSLAISSKGKRVSSIVLTS